MTSLMISSDVTHNYNNDGIVQFIQIRHDLYAYLTRSTVHHTMDKVMIF